MKVGHDVTLLWVNGRHYAVVNHHTGKMLRYALSDAVGPYKPLTNGCAALCLALMVGPAVFFLALFALGVALPHAWPNLLHAIAPAHRWTYPEVNGLFSELIGWGVAASILGTWIGYRISNRRARAYNARLDAELQDALEAAVDQPLRAYRVPGHGVSHLS